MKIPKNSEPSKPQVQRFTLYLEKKIIINLESIKFERPDSKKSETNPSENILKSKTEFNHSKKPSTNSSNKTPESPTVPLLHSQDFILIQMFCKDLNILEVSSEDEPDKSDPKFSNKNKSNRSEELYSFTSSSHSSDHLAASYVIC